MHNNVAKKVDNKGLIRLALIIVLILIQGFLFLNTWLVNYNSVLRFPYVLKGNVFLMLIYMILLFIFMLVFDCNGIFDSRISNLIFSETLASISCNILVYFVMIIPAAALGLMAFKPIIYLTIKDIIVIIIWSYIAHVISVKLFPPKDMLLISSSGSLDREVFKFQQRKDIYNIKITIEFNNNAKEIYDLCDNFDNIIIGDISSECRNDLIKYCFNNNKNIYVVPKISDILLKYSDDVFTFDMPIYLTTNAGLSLENSIFKRTFDIILSLLVIVIFFPIWFIVALAIKIEDGGPILFTQDRITKNGKQFSIYKYRSMKVNADKITVLPTVKNDPRITKVGSIIRKFHIDEIPQFLNVLVGDMSVVGPRPERKEHVELYTKNISEFEFRQKVNAGITGLAQIYGKYNTSAIDKLKLDLIYIKSYSLRFDIELILRTIKVLFIKDNTEGFDKKTQEYIKNNA